jgi:hypothetical protein
MEAKQGIPKASALLHCMAVDRPLISQGECDGIDLRNSAICHQHQNADTVPSNGFHHMKDREAVERRDAAPRTSQWEDG